MEQAIFSLIPAAGILSYRNINIGVKAIRVEGKIRYKFLDVLSEFRSVDLSQGEMANYIIKHDLKVYEKKIKWKRTK